MHLTTSQTPVTWLNRAVYLVYTISIRRITHRVYTGTPVHIHPTEPLQSPLLYSHTYSYILCWWLEAIYVGGVALFYAYTEVTISEWLPYYQTFLFEMTVTAYIYTELIFCG